MEIRIIKTEKEYHQYFSTRKIVADKILGDKSKHNISKSDKYEIDAYDFESIHIACFENKKMIASARLIINLKSEIDIENQNVRRTIIGDFANTIKPRDYLGLYNYATKEQQHKMNVHYKEITKNYQISETSRLMRVEQNDEKYLMSYMISYIWALNLFYNIDYTYFSAIKSYGKYYHDFFNAVRVLNNIKFKLGRDEDFYIMRSNMKTPNQKTASNIFNILHEFNNAEIPCAVAIDKIKTTNNTLTF